MPKIKSEAIRIGGVSCLREVKVDSHGFFSAKFPSFMVDVVGKEAATGHSLTACLEMWQAKVLEYEKAKTVPSKVILYQFEANCFVEGPDGIRLKQLSFSPGTGLALACGVYEELKITLERSTRYEYKELKSSIPAGFSMRDAMNRRGGENRWRTQVPWTPEREAWFLGLCNALIGLVRKLDAIANNGEKKLLEAITKGRLLGPAEAALDA